MCGRFAFFSPAEAVIAAFGPAPAQSFTPRYNIAPTQDTQVLLNDESGTRIWASLRWGLVPSWAKDPTVGNRMINARAETIAEKPAYRAAFKRRRCLIPASGFFEWQKVAEGAKTPWYISRKDGLPLAMAGIWEHRKRQAGEDDALPAELFTFSILTTAANEFMRPLHHRMPVLLNAKYFSAWLDSDHDASQSQEVLAANTAAELQAWPVSRAVNSPRNDRPEIVNPVSAV